MKLSMLGVLVADLSPARRFRDKKPRSNADHATANSFTVQKSSSVSGILQVVFWCGGSSSTQLADLDLIVLRRTKLMTIGYFDTLSNVSLRRRI